MRFSQRQANVNIAQADIANNDTTGNRNAQNGAPIVREETRNNNNNADNRNNAYNNNNNYNRDNNGQRKSYCHICKKSGHLTRDCKFNRQNDNANNKKQNNSNNKVPCAVGKDNHVWKDCFQLSRRVRAGEFNTTNSGNNNNSNQNNKVTKNPQHCEN